MKDEQPITLKPTGKLNLSAWLSKDKRLPSRAAMVGNAARAVARNAVSVAKGNPVSVPESVRVERHTVCKLCEKYLADMDRCSHRKCGCVLRAKVWLWAEKCPDGKW